MVTLSIKVQSNEKWDLNKTLEVVYVTFGSTIEKTLEIKPN